MIRGVIENQAHLFFNESPPDFYTLIPTVTERTDLFFKENRHHGLPETDPQHIREV